MLIHLGIVILLVILSSCRAVAGKRDVDATDDRAQIEAHVRGLFEAYLHGDREAIRRGHTQDWHGFPIPATQIVRGIDDYMAFAERSLADFRGTDYEIHEMEVQVSGDVGIVYYTATWRYQDEEGVARELPLRSVDVYRRDAHGWNQCGSNICAAPMSISAGT